MPIHHSLWTVGPQPVEVAASRLPDERLLEEMIVAAPRILSEQWMLIGRQLETGTGGRVDLLAVAPDGALVLIELKRDRTPREVVAQALDYACWVETLQAEEIDAIYGRFAGGRSLAADFAARFGQELDGESLNSSHQIVVVAAQLDASTERIVGYLSKRGVAINILFFQVFQGGENQLLSRAWLLDPVEAQANAASAPPRTEKEPWNGEFYASFGEGANRSWAEARAHGFISAGGGTWYSNTLDLLSPGDRVWVKVPGRGFVGVGRVTGPRQAAADFSIDGRPAMAVLTAANYHREFIDDSERSEYFVPVEWLDTVPVEHAIQEVGMFGNQNSVCKPRTPGWRTTVERLKDRFASRSRHG